jgi:predicted DsbA family dithiol-disulfide isomerase
MHDELFTDPVALEDGDLLAYARRIGLEPEPFSECRRDPAVVELIQADRRGASALGVSSTPAFLIGELALALLCQIDRCDGRARCLADG